MSAELYTDEPNWLGWALAKCDLPSVTEVFGLGANALHVVTGMGSIAVGDRRGYSSR
jgi:hypothetical protein